MTIKVGDKVKIIGKYSVNEGKIGIVVDVDENWVKVFGSITDYSYSREDLELVEVATYVPVPKFKVGDTVWFKAIDDKTYSGLIVKDRDDKMNYKLFVENYPTKQYIGYGSFINYEDKLVDIAEDKLSKEQTKE